MGVVGSNPAAPILPTPVTPDPSGVPTLERLFLGTQQVSRSTNHPIRGKGIDIIEMMLIEQCCEGPNQLEIDPQTAVKKLIKTKKYSQNPHVNTMNQIECTTMG